MYPDLAMAYGPMDVTILVFNDEGHGIQLGGSYQATPVAALLMDTIWSTLMICYEMISGKNSKESSFWST